MGEKVMFRKGKSSCLQYHGLKCALCEKVTEEEKFFRYYKNTKTTYKIKEDKTMTYVCDACRWEYNEAEGYPEGGIAPGTKWEDVPEDFQCPVCLAGKDLFVEG